MKHWKSWVPVVAAALLIGASAVPRSPAALKVNFSVPFPRDGYAKLNLRKGAIRFEEIIVRNPPDEDDIRDARRDDPGDHCHPKLSVGLSNTGRVPYKFHMVLQLEDARGKVLMRCDRNDDIDAGDVNDHTHFCWLDSMRTLDYPRIAKIRIIAEFKPD
ncbi:MAG: hypothetical protein P8Z49_02125 [Acidobacteriota bacterium]|jgi:hypothetical protein